MRAGLSVESISQKRINQNNIILWVSAKHLAKPQAAGV